MQLGSILTRFALVTLGFALAFGLAEVAARIFEQQFGQCDEPEETPGSPVIVSVFDLARPGMSGVTLCNVPYRTNRFGFRGPEVRRKKPPGVFRIVIGGDSVTMGSGIPEDQTYSSQLQNLLNEGRDRGRRFETLNLGISGLPIRQVVSRIERIGVPLDPDLIVYGWTINDIEDTNYRMASSKEDRRGWLEEPKRFANSSSRLVAIVGPRLAELWRRREPGYQFELFDNYFDNERAWADFTRELDRLAVIQRRTGACTVVFIHTQLQELDAEHTYLRIYDKVEHAALERGLFTIQSFAAFEGRRISTIWVAIADPHPNALGHSILAESLREGLEALPDRCWQGRGGSPGS